MKKLLFLSLALGLVGFACSQAEKHPNMLGDCDVCTPNVGGGTIGEAGAKDSGLDSSDDGDAGDAALPDAAPDAIDLDGADE